MSSQCVMTKVKLNHSAFRKHKIIVLHNHVCKSHAYTLYITNAYRVHVINLYNIACINVSLHSKVEIKEVI